MRKIIKTICVLILALSTNAALAKKPVKPPPEAGNLKNVITVSAENGDFTNPIDAINSIIDASETNPYLIQIGPGVYDLGANQIVMKEWVSIQGAGQETTIISGNPSGSHNYDYAVFVGANNASLMNLSIEHVGGVTFAVGILNERTSPRIDRVTINVSGGNGNTGIDSDGSSSTITNTRVTATGGNSSQGIYIHACGVPCLNDNPILLNVTAIAEDATQNAGIYISYSSPIINNVYAKGAGGPLVRYNLGISNTNHASPYITNSILEGGTALILEVDDTGARVTNNKIIGGVIDDAAGTQCHGNYDENLADVDC